jgi:hypothetical protein
MRSTRLVIVTDAKLALQTCKGKRKGRVLLRDTVQYVYMIWYSMSNCQARFNVPVDCQLWALLASRATIKL